MDSLILLRCGEEKEDRGRLRGVPKKTEGVASEALSTPSETGHYRVNPIKLLVMPYFLGLAGGHLTLAFFLAFFLPL